MIASGTAWAAVDTAPPIALHVHLYEGSPEPVDRIKHKIKDEPGDYQEEYEQEGSGYKRKVKEKAKPGEHEYEEETEYEDAYGRKRTVKFKRKCVKGVCEVEYKD